MTNTLRFFRDAVGLIILTLALTTQLQAQFEVVSVSPDNGAVNVDELTDVSVTFSEPFDPFGLLTLVDLGLLGDLGLDLGGGDGECAVPPIAIGITPSFCAESFTISSDGRTLTLQNVQLEADTAHTIIVLFATSRDGEFVQPFVSRFSTGPTLPQGSVSGTVTAGSIAAEKTAEPEITAVLLVPVDLFSIDLESVSEPFIGFPDEAGAYSIEFIPEGEYFPLAVSLDLEALSGLGKVQFLPVKLGGYDPDGDAVINPAVVAGPTPVTGIDIMTSSGASTSGQVVSTAAPIIDNMAPGSREVALASLAMNTDGTSLLWMAVFASLQRGELWGVLSFGELIFPALLLESAADGGLFLSLFGSATYTDHVDSPAAVDFFRSAGGASFLASYAAVTGFSALFDEFLWLLVEQLLDQLRMGGGLDLGLQSLDTRDGFDQLVNRLSDVEPVAKRTQQGAVWAVGFVDPIAPGLWLTVVDGDAGTPLFVVGSETAKSNEPAAAAAATNWAADAELVRVSSEGLPLDVLGNSIIWGFDYYSASKDSVLNVIASGGEFGGVLLIEPRGASSVPSTEVLPDNWIDSPAALTATADRGDAFRAAHPGAIVTGELSNGLRGQGEGAVWRFNYQGSDSQGQPEEMPVDVDAESGGVLVATEDDIVLPRSFALEQNYPNPFNPSTLIGYRISERADVRLEVYNTLGQRIATLVDRELPAGSYQATWDGTADVGTGVPSGVYIYRLEAGDDSQTKRMILLQ